MGTIWKGDAAKLRRKVSKAIDTRVASSRGSIGIGALRNVVRLQVPEIWQAQYAKAIGAAGVRKLTANDLSALLYAAAWCRAYGRDISEYLGTFGPSGALEI